MQKVTVLGSGVLGSQIAFQSAFHGKDVVVRDLDDAILVQLPARWEYLAAQYRRDLPDASEEKLAAAVARIRVTSDLADAVGDADLVIEAVPEVLDVKRDTWAAVGGVAPERTIFATNSSTLLPSAIADATGRPERFLALHFANTIWRQNTAEVMGHPGTDPACFDAVATFADEIGMVVIPVLKEQPGYVLNSLLVPFLTAASTLFVRGVADVPTIDLTWRKATGAPLGPFQIYDVIGMQTPYQLSRTSPDPEQREFAAILKRDYIDQGKLGVASGQGFYDYR
ncbi:3-hydroxybutyryl-CoA dehydrogenase [Tersicoccus solisilvae]|uniref:3-hydroxybutyryl-CoA dehydrogenase n=1 Tax=Tersicoccus solisilvae TaxID=1882339 RepID=A0ABQ1PL14_9MICC|nr:3-hydroxyacyl-CoA dehydrogenase [Tersicoccus solisilvae]GGC98945.1 3-hydroxybutyryl-CoA dehydrogenase [Tersicoccus solisilvae]